MWEKSLFRCGLITIFALALVGCASQMKLQPDQTYFALKPAESLGQSESAAIPENLFVKVENVADMGTSYKNRLELYINGKLIKPSKEISNYQNTYTYKLKLQPGIYKVKALYFASDGWKEKTYQIVPREKVKIKPNIKTILSAYVWKRWDGVPTQKVMLFDVKYEPLSESPLLKTEAKPEKSQPVLVKPTQASPTMKMKPVEIKPRLKKGEISHQAKLQPPEKIVAPAIDDLIILQINTAPANADIIVDDKYVGQSPLKVYIDRNSSHIVQISCPGYEEVMKFLDFHQFGNQKVVHLMQKLEPKPTATQK